MKAIHQHIVGLCLLLLCLATGLQAQIYPITTTVQINPPRSTYLFDYTAPGSNRFQVNLFLNDFNEPEYDVRLKLRITGNGINLETNPNYQPAPLTLQPGGNLLVGADLVDYFNPQNLITNGIDPAELLENGGGLPEGMYEFCITVYDYIRPEKDLSQPNCAIPTLLKNNPPLIVFPQCGATIPVNQGAQDILFQWQSMADPNIPAQYEFTMVEVPDGVNPNDALDGAQTPLVDAETTSMPQYNYGPSNVDLELGKTYAYRIRVEDIFGQTTFENDGLSEVCWFSYGYSATGPVPLIAPDDQFLTRTDQQIAFQWGRPVQLPAAQKVSYLLRVVELQPNQDPTTAIEYNNAVYEIRTPILPANGSEVLPNDLDLPNERAYVWNVTAMSDDVQVGQSEPRIFYTTPRVAQFKIGNPFENLVIVRGLTAFNELPNGDLVITGSGEIVVDKEGTTRVIPFADVTVTPYTDFWEVATGEIRVPFNDWKIDLDHSGSVVDSDDRDYDGNAGFKVDELVLTNSDTKLTGSIQWDFPHATNASGGALVESETVEVMYNDYEILNNYIPIKTTSFDLLDPAGFSIELESNGTDASMASINGDNKLTLDLHGKITTPSNVTDVNGQRIDYHFEDINNPYFFTVQVEGDNDIRALPGTTLQLNAQSLTIDLSETESPDKIAEPTWKGIYLNTYELIFPVTFDDNNQLILFDEHRLSFDLNDGDTKTWVDAGGLQFKQSQTYTDETGPRAYFNTFPDNFTEWSFEVTDNAVVSAEIQGFIYIPFFSKDERFTYTIPFDNNGSQQSFLDESINGREVVINDDKPELRSVVTIQQAIFKDNNHLEMTVDLAWDHLDLNLTNLTGLNLYGNRGIGFGAVNQAKSIPQQVSVEYYEGFTMHLSTVLIGLSHGAYFVGIEGDAPLTQDLTDIDGGAPIAVIVSHDANFTPIVTGESSSAPPDDSEASTALQNFNTVATAIKDVPIVSDYVGTLNSALQGKVNVTIPFSIKTQVVELKGMLKVNHNNPDWGTCFAGKLDGSFKAGGGTVTLGGTVVVGKQTTYKYWLAEVRVKVGSAPTPAAPAAPTGSHANFGTGGGPTMPPPSNAPPGTHSNFARSGPPGTHAAFASGASADTPKPDANTNVTGNRGIFSKGVLLPLGPVSITGLRGRVYHHMSSGYSVETLVDPNYNNIPDYINDDMSYTPDNSVSYGGLFGINAIDTKTAGTIASMYGAMELSFTSGGALEMLKVEVAGTFGNIPASSPAQYALKSYGAVYMNQTDETWAGGFKIGPGNAAAGLCGGGALTFLFTEDVQTFNVGSQQHPVGVYPCMGGVYPSGFLAYRNDPAGKTLDAGLYVGFGFKLTAPWIGPPKFRFRPWIDFNARIGGIAAMELEPEFRINSIGIDLNAYLAVGADYELLVKKGSFTLLSAALSGNLTLRFKPLPKNLSGALTGSITIPVIGTKSFTIGFSKNYALLHTRRRPYGTVAIA